MAMAQINDQQLMIEKAEVLWTQVDKTPGTILSHHHGLEVACGQGILRILRCQVAGKRMMDWETMRAGYAERWSVGTVFTKV
jgi:methionyl-tRNA formyltransferase